MILSNNNTIESIENGDVQLNNLKANKDIYDDAMHNTITVPDHDWNLKRKKFEDLQ